MKNAGKARSYGLYRHLRTSKEIIENLLNYFIKNHMNSKKDQLHQPVFSLFISNAYIRYIPMLFNYSL